MMSLFCLGKPQQSVQRCILALWFVVPASAAVAQGIPEPPIVLYGIVTDALGKRLTEGQINVAVTPASGGTSITVSTNLTDINLQFSYVLSIPCESLPTGATPTPGVLQLRTVAGSRATVAVRLGAAGLQPYTSAEQSFPITVRDRGSLVPVNLSTVPYEDTDRDGLLDSWERTHFGGLASGPNDDPDADGRSNLVEQRGGTDPKSSASAPEFVAVELVSGATVRVTWSTQRGLRYRLLRSLQVTPAASYQPVTEPLLGDGTNLTREDVLPTEVEAAFYRVEVVP